MKSWFLLIATSAALLSSTVAQAEVVVGPRVSYYFDNSNLRVSDLAADVNPAPVIDAELTQILIDNFGDESLLTSQDEGTGRLADQVSFPMIGGSVSFGGDRDRFTLTAVHGSGSGNISTIFNSSRTLSVGDVEITDLSIANISGGVDIDRYDLEFTWQRRLNEKFAIFGGLRYERLDSNGASTIRVQGTQVIDELLAELQNLEPPPTNIDARLDPEVPTSLTYQNTTQTYSLRAGVSAFVPVNSSMTAFFNGMIHGSYQPDYNTDTAFFNFAGDPIGVQEIDGNGEISAGPDIAVGAQFLITENISMDLRYRAVLFFPLSGDFSFDDARVNHGVNLGLSFRL